MTMPDRKAEIEAVSRYIPEIIALLAAVLFVIYSVYLSYLDSDPMMFARSGSILVLVAAIVEARNYTAQQRLNNSAQKSAGYIGGALQDFSLPKHRKVFELVTLFLVVFGTLIWGYGDLLLEKFIQK